MRKLYIYLLLLGTFFLVSMQQIAASTAITDVRWVTRNDAPISYVRMVLDLSNPLAKADATIQKDGLSTQIVLKNTSFKDAPRHITMDPNIAKSLTIAQSANDIVLTVQTPKAIDTKDLKIFQLKADASANKPQRLVIDISQTAVSPRERYYGMEQNKVDAKQLDANVRTESLSKKTEGGKRIATKLTSKTKVETGKTKGKDAKTNLKDRAREMTQPLKVAFRTDGGIKGKIIALDPGHGGSDVGAIGPTNLYEKDVTLPIAKKLEDLLTKAGAKVVMTRTKDTDVFAPHASAVDELQARADVANEAHADIFLSIHINSFTNPEVGGISTYYYQKTAFDKKLAADIGSRIATEPRFHGDRGVNQAQFYVLNHSLMPAALLEIGFISNPKEEALLKTEQVQNDFAELIFQGITEYFKG